jgi:hypothetical protein
MMRNGLSQKLTSQSHKTLGENIDKIFMEIDTLKQQVVLQKKEIQQYETLLKKKEQVAYLLETKNKSQAKTIDSLTTENKVLRQHLPRVVATAGLFAHPPKNSPTENTAPINRAPWR